MFNKLLSHNKQSIIGFKTQEDGSVKVELVAFLNAKRALYDAPA